MDFTPADAAAINASVLAGVPLAMHPSALSQAASISLTVGSMKPAGWSQPFQLVGRVALVSVTGILMHKLGILGTAKIATGYDAIMTGVAEAAEDKGIKAIALDVDTPGGLCSGLFDLGDVIFEARMRKPVMAILSDRAFSAGYLIASAASIVTVPQNGGTGHIGIIVTNVDATRAIGNAGLKIDLLTSTGADRKTDGHSEVTLTDDARSAIQAEIDALGNMFANKVARNRGVDAADILALKAATFFGAAGVTAGLADFVMAPDAAFAALVADTA